MPARKYVKPDEPVGLNLTAAERTTILKDVEFLDDDYEQALRETPAAQAIEFTLGERKTLMAKSKPKNWIAGRWLIESMDQWDRDFIDEEVRGYFEFDTKGSGDFQFGYVHGQIDYRVSERDGKPAVDYTWDGNDEMDPAQGRGWFVLEGEELRGKLLFHLGDDSGIVLKREPEKKPKTTGKRK